MLNLRRSAILPPLPDRAGPDAPPPPDAAHRAVAPELLRLSREARRTTLAGALFLDLRGVSLDPAAPLVPGAAPQVRAALIGRVGLAGMIGATLLSAAIVGFLLLRLISRPVRHLGAQAQGIAEGRLSEADPLTQYGARELAELGRSVIRMSRTLVDRSRQVTAYTDHVTHELKSPVTAILAAAELLGSEDLSPDARARLQGAIAAQAERMNALLEGLRELTRHRHARTTGSGALADMLPDLPGLSVRVAEGSAEIVPLLPEHGRIVLQQFASNALAHGARTMTAGYRDGVLTVRDDGEGIDPGDLDRVADPFFTTRRETGGTGLGLAVVSAILQNYDAALRFEPADRGASIRIDFAASSDCIPRPRNLPSRRAERLGP